LATDGKTPLREAATSNSGRTKKTVDRSKVARRRVIAGVAGAVVLVGGIFLLTRGDSPIIDIGNDAPVGKVNFVSKGVTFIPTELGGDTGAQQTTAKTSAGEVRRQIDTLFETSYVDPSTWGDTGKVEDLFADGAKGQLDGDIGTLTLGQNAGDTYKTVDPGKSTVKVSVLTDGNGNAIRASAKLTFKALATHDDGTYSAITVTGTMLFVKDGDTWKIEAYGLNRSEKPAKAPTTPSGSTSPTSEAS
jgi:hypothetical protein